jgi:hypothetical protein
MRGMSLGRLPALTGMTLRYDGPSLLSVSGLVWRGI